MSPKLLRKLTLPAALFLIGCYFIGLRVYQNRTVPISAPVTTLSAESKTEEEENRLLSEIGDKININTATESELMLLDDIGETIAKRIIEKREELGGFTALEQLLEVKGIGEKLFENIKNYITI